MHLLQPIAYQFERFTEPLLQRALQFLIDVGAHFSSWPVLSSCNCFSRRIDDASHASRAKPSNSPRCVFRLVRILFAASRHLFTIKPLAAFLGRAQATQGV